MESGLSEKNTLTANQTKCPHCLGTEPFDGFEYCDVWAAHCREGLAFFGIKGTFRGVPIPDRPTD